MASHQKNLSVDRYKYRFLYSVNICIHIIGAYILSVKSYFLRKLVGVDERGVLSVASIFSFIDQSILILITIEEICVPCVMY